MKIKHLVTVLTIFFFSFTYATYAQNHVVKKGETVYAIANKYSISVQDIYTLNPTATQGIREGQTLKVGGKDSGQYRKYTVKSKETLYSISKANNVSVQELLDANPTIKTSGLQEGQTLKMPSKPIEHKVEKKETLFGIARIYGVSEQAILNANPQLSKGLKKGATIVIPFAESATTTAVAYKAEGFPKTDTKTLKIGIFLPFTNESNAHRARFVEYYRGFLIAVQELKAKGYSMDIYAFDIENNSKMQSLLESDDIKDLHLVVGGVTEEEVLTLANYTKRNNIKYVVPFPIKDQTKLGENCFVISRPNQALEKKAISQYAEQAANQNVFFIKEGSNNNREQFVSQLETQLKGKATTLTYSSSLENDLSSLISARNVFIPTSSSQAALARLSTVLKSLKTKYPEYEFSLLGYPDWQTYAHQQNDLKTLNASIYSSFFLDETSYWVKEFTSKYEKWYKTGMMRIYPKYGVLGYDTGIYFLTALSRFGFDFEKKIANADISTLQTAIQLSQSKTGGCYVNDGLYIVHYSESDIKKEKYN